MRNYPIVLVVLFFSIGIAVQKFLDVPILVLATIVILVILALISFLLLKKNYFTIILVYALAGLFGTVSISVDDLIQTKYPFDIPKIRNAKIIGTIESIDLIKNEKLSLNLKLNSVNDINLGLLSNNKFTCSFWKDSTSRVDEIYELIKIGNQISFIGTIDKARNQRNPGEFDYEEYLNSNGISGLINCYKVETFEIVNHNILIIGNTVFSIRKRIDARIKLLHTDTYANLLKGILLADRSDIDYEIKDSFTNAGVIHVLAVSGLHVGFVAVIIFLVLGRFNIRLKYILTIMGILLFLIITGGHSSVFRASIMAIFYFIAKLTGRSTNGFNSISVAAFIILILNPNELFNAGFLLSFSAVFSILIFYPKFSTQIKQFHLSSLVEKILLFMSVSFAAQIGTLPFTIYYFNKLSLIALLANLIVIPALGIILSIGIITLLFSIFSVFIASIFAETNIMIISVIYYFIEELSNLSFSFIPIFSFSIYDGLIFYLSLTALFVISSITKEVKFRIPLLIIVIFISSLAFTFDNIELLPDGELSILTIDVGQGDSFLVKFPNNKTALIDAGNSTEFFDNGERIIYPLMQRLGIDKINYGFISHIDSDHYGGFVYLLNEGLVDTVFKPKSDNSIKDIVFEEYLNHTSTKLFYYSDTSFSIGGAEVLFMNDTTILNDLDFDSNNNSGIIKISFGNNSFLFTGDAELEMEEYLVENYSEVLQSDVLKIGHHGSKSSTSLEFLEAVNPKIGIVSAGVMNHFNHPAKSVISKLQNRNIEIRRTDEEGAILLVSNGEEINNIDWRNIY